MTAKAVFFDLDGTVLPLPESYASVVHETTAAHLGARDEDFEVTYSERFLELLGDLADDPYRSAFEHALAEHGYADADPEALVETLREREIAATAPPTGLADVLDALREDDWRLGVLTNGVPAFQRAKLEAHGLVEHFDEVVVSYEAGAHKPDERAFALAAERLPADEYVMVGDSHAADVGGARAMGWQGIHYAPDGESPDGDDAIGDFDALLDMLD